jgi:ABC-2 type transport system ATP-binding protein
VFGCDSRRLNPTVKGRIGYVAEGHKLLGHLSVDALRALNRGVTSRFNDEFFDHLIGRLKLPMDRKVRRLSNGQRAQLALALALATEPELLIMDDPTLGLDTVLRREFLELAIDLIQRERRSILITSHILSDVERLADHIAILHDQRIVVDCTLEGLKKAVQKLRLTWPDEPPTELPAPGLIAGKRRGREWVVTMAGVNDQRLALLRSLGPDRIEPVPMSLEEIFVEYAGNTNQVDGGTPCGS